MFFCCCTEEKEGYDSLHVEEKETKLVRSTPALGSSAMPEEEKQCFHATLRRNAEGKLDLVLEKSDTDYVMIKKITPALAEWNKTCRAGQQIAVMDRILEVGGMPAPGKELAKALEVSSAEVTLLLQRPQIRTLRLKRPGKLGIIANYMPNYSLKPWIDTIADGLVNSWNQDNPDASVREHDRIMSVNGVSNPPEDVVIQMRKQDDLEIVILHYPC
ncbi:unnamed protein product [Effrenium voratum]|uniref:PDZ domain-containing protein n=1 Tax=Effrenium voratum TaxID=2562239 RepID=A0AA36I2P7_9DINO|nr:unnamed protein product [Effrenium voratum]CAJ1431951.1 unnamed protein product [Effrenium voratum]